MRIVNALIECGTTPKPFSNTSMIDVKSEKNRTQQREKIAKRQLDPKWSHQNSYKEINFSKCVRSCCCCCFFVYLHIAILVAKHYFTMALLLLFFLLRLLHHGLLFKAWTFSLCTSISYQCNAYMGLYEAPLFCLAILDLAKNDVCIFIRIYPFDLRVCFMYLLFLLSFYWTVCILFKKSALNENAIVQFEILASIRYM